VRKDGGVFDDALRTAVGSAVHVPLLIVLGGLPGTGKTTVARGLAGDLSAVHLRIDTIEEIIRKASDVQGEVVDVGYRVAYGLALDNLRLGHWVIADAVNPLPLVREAWRAVADAGAAGIVEIELVCSDPEVHRARVGGRTADIAGATLPSWEDVAGRHYVPWEPTPVRIDTSVAAPQDCVRQALTAIMRAQGPPLR
jgi:predicted kinase